jgi:hypothetical protein
MTKPIRLRPKSRTHFEQVPLEIVKKLVVPDVLKKPHARTGDVVREPASSKKEPYSMGAHRYL